MGKHVILLIVISVIVMSGLIEYSPMIDTNDSFLERSEMDIGETTAVEVANLARTSTFFENIGQIKDYDIQYYGAIPGGMVGFGISSIYLWADGCVDPVLLSFPDSSKVTPEGVNDVGFKTNYFLGTKGTFRDVSGYRNIQYQDLWSGIDLEFSAGSHGAKYEFILEPYADPSDVLLEVNGHEEIAISHSTVDIFTKTSVFRDDGLEVYQDCQVIDSVFVRHDSDSFGVRVGEYDESKVLVIDPLLYSTYIGGSSFEHVADLTIDGQGNAYVVGYSRSSNFPILNGYDSTLEGDRDAYVFKLDTHGNLVYSTFLGGSSSDEAYGVVVDSSGCAYVTGYSESSDFPTVNAYDSTLDGSSDCFIVKLNDVGNILHISTYVNTTSSGHAIVMDDLDNIYVLGGTRVFKMDSDLTEILYSFGISGSNYDSGEDLTVDSEGCAYVVGLTRSTDFPTFNAFDDTCNADDCFLFKINSTGTGLVFSTFIGGTGDEAGRNVRVDASGCIYLTGQTESSNFPTVNPYFDTYNGSRDVFVLKMNQTGNGLIYSTYIGGTNVDYAFGMDLDAYGCAYISVATRSSNFPVVNSYDPSWNGGTYDVVVLKLNQSGNDLLYSTFIGGSDFDHPWAMVVDDNGSAYVGIYTKSTNFPLVNAYDSSFNGDHDIAVCKLPDLGDTDYDALSDYDEILLGSDRFDWDTDSDLMPDGWEVWAGLDPLIDDASGDLDDDTLTNLEEFNYGTFPFYFDTDFDLLPDPWEIEYGLDPLTVNTFDDPDQDGLENIDEFDAGTHPLLNDTDSDFLMDSDELIRQCDPLDNDTDSDSILDGIEVYTYGTNPTNSDSDLDGISDPDELFVYVSNPLSSDSDLDQMPDLWEVENSLEINIDDADEDPDEDQLTNLEEYQNGTDPHVADSDDDGAEDGWEVSNGFDPTDPTVPFNQFLLMNIGLVTAGIGGVVGVIVVAVVVLKRKR